MLRKILKSDFFDRPTPRVARELLGKFLVRRYPSTGSGQVGKEIAGMITEVEVYDGFKDLGSHARRGRTARNWPMFGPGGVWYVYFTYGMHWMLNITTREKDYPAAILIRSIKFIEDGELRPALRAANLSGPGRLTKHFKIDGSLSGKIAVPKTGLWLEDRGIKISPRHIRKGPRIGINYAGPVWVKKPWRFWLEV